MSVCQFILLCSLGVLRICYMHFIGYMNEGNIKNNHKSLTDVFEAGVQDGAAGESPRCRDQAYW